MAQSTTESVKRAAAQAVAAGETRAGGPYRFWGAVSTVVFGLLLLWAVIELFDGDRIVRPEVRWTAAEVQGEPVQGTPYQVDAIASDVLSQRTQLQRDREVSGPSPSSEAPAAAMGDGQRLVANAMEPDATLPRLWMTPDEEMLQLLPARDTVIGTSNLPYTTAPIYQRADARDWRVGMAEWVNHVGAIIILGACFLMSLTLALRGRVPIVHGRDRQGRSVKRFSFFERLTHWTTAISFIGLSLTGVVIGFGVTLFLPFGEYVLGAMGWLSTWGHMMFAPPFFLGILAMALMWTKGNLPDPKLDIPWIRRFGGFMSNSPDHPHARRFNAGQKVSFWAATLGGLVMVATGVTAMFPYWYVGIEWMASVMLIHALVGVLLIAFFLGHIYIGSVGMEGAFEAMWTGEVDRNWASEHHDLWVRELEGGKPAEDQKAGFSLAGERPTA